MQVKNLLPLVSVVMFLGCAPNSYVGKPSPQEALVTKGRLLFFNETFNGNGRVCASCHPDVNNTVLDPSFIATTGLTDPLFVAESNPQLGSNFENPRLMRGFGLILENLDGFEDPPNKFTQRGIPHTLGLSSSVKSKDGPRTGWSGDGAPGDGSLRSFATGAVIQHFTKSMNRIPEVDFRLPTDEELDALEAFQLALGRQKELQLPLPLKDKTALRGQEIFNDLTTGKCFACHDNAGANANPGIFGAGAGNLNFNTGVEDLPDQAADLSGELIPPDDGFGRPGDGTFNTPSLVEAADTAPFFHNNSIKTLEGAIAFYNGDSFTNSPAGELIIGATGSGINLDASQVDAVAAFLRVINAVENITESLELLDRYLGRKFLGKHPYDRLTIVAASDTEDARMVLAEANLHPLAITNLTRASDMLQDANAEKNPDKKLIKSAMNELTLAKNALIQSQ